MTTAPPTETSSATRCQPMCIGADLSETQIRAAVFANATQLSSKAKKSTKLERGVETVLDRLTRCILDAADEADLTIHDVAAIGLGVPGAVDATTGCVLSAPQLGWSNIALRSALERRLGIPVRLANIYSLGALGIFGLEWNFKPRSLIALFPGVDLGGGFIRDGQCDGGFILQGKGTRPALGHGQHLALTEDSAVRALRSKELRKAIRRGEALVERFSKQVAQCTGAAVAHLIQTYQPEVIALGGSVVEELRQEIHEAALKEIRVRAGDENRMPATDVFFSRLGDDATLLGAALHALGHAHRPVNR